MHLSIPGTGTGISVTVSSIATMFPNIPMLPNAAMKVQRQGKTVKETECRIC